MTPTEDTPTILGGLAHDTRLKAQTNQVVTSIAESLVGIGGHLECTECGLVQSLAEGDMVARLTNGWPKHCGYTMRWITARQEAGNDLAKNSPDTTSADTQIRPGEHKKQELERLQDV